MFKKYTTFTLMKKRRTIFLNIILFLFIVLYSGIAAHSILDTQTAYMELSPVNDNNENRLCSNTDSPDNDQIDQVSLSDIRTTRMSKKWFKQHASSKYSILFCLATAKSILNKDLCISKCCMGKFLVY